MTSSYSWHNIENKVWGVRLNLYVVRPGNFLASVEDAKRVRGYYQVCFLLSPGLRPFILDVGGGGRPGFSS